MLLLGIFEKPGDWRPPRMIDLDIMEGQLVIRANGPWLASTHSREKIGGSYLTMGP